MPVAAWHCFSAEAASYREPHETIFRVGRAPRRRRSSDNRGGPWGPGGGDDGGGGDGGGGGPRNPWGQPPRRRKPGRGAATSPRSTIPEEEPRPVRRRLAAAGRAALLALRPDRLRRCSGCCSPASTGSARRSAASSPPSAIISARCGPASASPGPRRSAACRRSTSSRSATIAIPDEPSTENLILTGDQNVIDLAYSVRWNIKRSRALPVPDRRSRGRPSARSPRARCARSSRGVSLDDAIGAGRGEIEQRVEQTHAAAARRLSAPASAIQGVAINQSVPPAGGQRRLPAKCRRRSSRRRATSTTPAPMRCSITARRRARRRRSTRSMPNIGSRPR